MKDSDQLDDAPSERLPNPRKRQWIRKRDPRLRFVHYEGSALSSAYAALNFTGEARGGLVSEYLNRRRRSCIGDDSV